MLYRKSSAPFAPRIIGITLIINHLPTSSITSRLLVSNKLPIRHLQKILGSICAEDYWHHTDYQPLTDQLNNQLPAG